MKVSISALLGLFAILPATAAPETPENIRVCVQFIKMPHTSMTELMSGKAQPGHVLHEKAMAMTTEGKAKLLESGVVVVRNRSMAAIETFQELIYPTEYVPPQIPCSVGSGGPLPLSPDPPSSPQPRGPFMFPAAYETRNTGLSLEVEPTFDASTQLIDLRFLPENVDRLNIWTIKEHRDQWGNAPLRMPTFETWRSNIRLALSPGKFELAATITPKPTEAVPATLRKILVFVRCDVMPAIPKP